LGVDFGRSKPDQTISRFFWVFDKDPRYKFAEIFSTGREVLSRIFAVKNVELLRIA